MSNLTPSIIHVNFKQIEIGRLSYDVSFEEFVFSINTQNREELIKANFPYDFYFDEGETSQKSKRIPILLSNLIPERQSLAEVCGIASTDHDWVKLVKIAQCFSYFRTEVTWMSPVAIEDIKPIHIKERKHGIV